MFVLYNKSFCVTLSCLPILSTNLAHEQYKNNTVAPDACSLGPPWFRPKPTKVIGQRGACQVGQATSTEREKLMTEDGIIGASKTCAAILSISKRKTNQTECFVEFQIDLWHWLINRDL